MNCPNCDHVISEKDKHCSECGQKNKSFKISMGQFIGDFFNEYFNFDSRFFKSIGPLLFKPAFLAEKFFEGKRSTYVNPLRFYIFVSFIAFFIAGYTDVSIVQLDGTDEIENMEMSKDGLVDIQINEEEESIDKKKIVRIVEQLRENEDDINRNFFRYVSISMFFLMPLFALITCLFFRKRKDHYIEHLILSFHIHTFFFIALIFSICISFFSDFPTMGVALLFLSIYTFLSMKKYFKTTWGGTVWRFFGTLLLYNFSALLVTIGVSILSLYFSGATDVFDLAK
ncbi:MAG: DUF3667 domain-containing protein [Flavobacteriales bacterium]|nr:DUF3667 domain-containing protein [Flavobacteriales bacterium]